jgi:GTP-binding protein
MIIDEVKITVAAGAGGRGAVAFDKNKKALGPTGASGGRGGDIIFEGVADISALRQFQYKKSIVAKRGMDGRSQFKDGMDSENLILKVPVGTVIHGLDLPTEISQIGQQVTLVKGGRGGKGNFHFRAPWNTTPKEFELGQPGEKRELLLELKLIADVGLVGLPNAGKSSLLNAVTNANSKVGAYPFTTLEPSLGAYYGLILADIPGLIEGASIGKGLGMKFLRHVERTKAIIHLVSADSEDVAKDYQIIREELIAYRKELGDKSEIVFLSKRDLVSEEEWEKKAKILSKACGQKIKTISVLDDESLEEVHKVLRKLLKEKTSIEEEK